MKAVATVHSSIVNLVKTIVGAGLLAIPFVFQNDGILLGIILTLLAAVTSGFGLFALAKCSKTMINPRNASFFTVCMMTNPRLSIINDFAMIVQCFGVGISYLVLIGDLFPIVFEGERNVWIIASVSVIVPLCLLRSIDSLKYSSLLGLFALTYLTLLVVSHFFYDVIITDNYESFRGDVNWVKIHDYSGFVTTFNIVIFAYTGAMNLFAIINELQENSMRNIRKVINNSIAIATVLFLIVGVTGYLTFGSNTVGNIMLNYNSKSIWTKIGNFCLGSMVVLSFPLLFHPLRDAINNIVIFYNYQRKQHSTTVCDLSAHNSEIINSTRPISLSVAEGDEGEVEYLLDGEVNITTEQDSRVVEPDVDLVTNPPELDFEADFPPTRFYIITFSLLFVMYVVALNVTSFALILAFVGATGSTSISFILPGYFGSKLIGTDSLAIGEIISDKDKFYKKCCRWLYMFGVFVMFVSLYIILTGKGE